MCPSFFAFKKAVRAVNAGEAVDLGPEATGRNDCVGSVERGGESDGRDLFGARELVNRPAGLPLVWLVMEVLNTSVGVEVTGALVPWP